MLLAGAALAYVVLEVRDNGATEDAGQSETEAAANPEGGEDSEGEATAQSDQDAAAPSDTATDSTLPIPTGAYIRAVYSGPQLVVTGVVPSPELVTGLDQAGDLVYQQYYTSEVTVDPSVGAPEWLAAAPLAIMLLQGLVEGEMVITDGVIHVVGGAADEQSRAEFEAELSATTGLPVVADGVQALGLRQAIYVLAGSDGQLALSGALPTEEVRQSFVLVAQQIYGADNVLDASTVDPEVARELWMFSPEPIIGVLAAFPEFEVRFDGAIFSSELAGGNVFPSGSAEFTDDFAQVLQFGISIMLRDPTLRVEIVGHTDDQGDEDSNLELSQQRADAVSAYVQAAGVPPERITAIGMGESDPVADNSTPEGQARNRRVEFSIIDTGLP